MEVGEWRVDSERRGNVSKFNEETERRTGNVKFNEEIERRTGNAPQRFDASSVSGAGWRMPAFRRGISTLTRAATRTWKTMPCLLRGERCEFFFSADVHLACMQVFLVLATKKFYSLSRGQTTHGI